MYVCTPYICTYVHSAEALRGLIRLQIASKEGEEGEEEDHYGWVVEHLQYRWSCRHMASIRCRGYNGNGVDWHLLLATYFR